MKKLTIFLFLLLFPGFFLQSNTASAEEKNTEYITVLANFSCWYKNKVTLQAKSPEGFIVTFRPCIVNCNDSTVGFAVSKQFIDWELKIVVE